MKKRTKRVPISSLKKRADAVFSLWIRARDKKCYTCGSKGNLQNGHYVSRSWNLLRYSEVNCHAQCIGCNVFRHGNMDVYAMKLIEQYGPDILKKLNKEKKPHSLTEAYLRGIIETYKLTQ